jgi:ABC-type Fe3+-hydroxamate transport system substrate-binding protein
MKFCNLEYTDQLHRKLELTSIPKRIVSLVPSQTELLYDLGLREEVVGITKFCIHPQEWHKNKTRIGGTKNIDFEKIKNLQPDLIIGNKEENEKGQIEELMHYFNVWMSDIYTLKDSFDMITRVGTIVGKQQEATMLKLQIESQFYPLINRQLSIVNRRCAYFIWRNPYIAVAKDTFIDEMLKVCGLVNVFSDLSRYPEVSPQQIAAANPEIILLSSEPYPFKDKYIQEFKVICPNAKIIIVDGELFSWYGSRMLKAPTYFEQLLAIIN